MGFDLEFVWLFGYFETQKFQKLNSVNLPSNFHFSSALNLKLWFSLSSKMVVGGWDMWDFNKEDDEYSNANFCLSFYLCSICF